MLGASCIATAKCGSAKVIACRAFAFDWIYTNPEVDDPISVKAMLLNFCFSCPLTTQALDFQFRPVDVLSSTLIKHRTAILC